MRCTETKRARSNVALAICVCALGCGGKAGGDSLADGPPAPSSRTGRAAPSPTSSQPRPTPASSPPAISGVMGSPSPPVGGYPENPPPFRESPPVDLAKAAAENVLEANCGACHGPSSPAAGGIDYINDLDQLVENGLIVPLDSAVSRVIRVMRDGSMPPPSSGLPRVTDADIEVLAQYIDNPRFWPTPLPVPEVVDAGTPAPVVDAGPDSG